MFNEIEYSSYSSHFVENDCLFNLKRNLNREDGVEKTDSLSYIALLHLKTRNFLKLR